MPCLEMNPYALLVEQKLTGWMSEGWELIDDLVDHNKTTGQVTES